MAELTAEEKRNLELIKGWAESWDKDPERMVDKVYADMPEVFLPLQKFYMSRKGKSKANWRAVEVAVHKFYPSRKMKFATLIARGDTVAMEVMTTSTNLKGITREGWFAAFLRFDKDGRVISDHTYSLNPTLIPDPERASDPVRKKMMVELRDALQTVTNENKV